MSAIKPRPTFHIVEPVPVDVDYESFKKDFLDPTTRVGKIKEKYGISHAEYRHLRQRAMDETGLSKKPTDYEMYNGWKNRSITETTNIQKKPNGFLVVKYFGSKSHYFGRYPDMETARMVRDKLIECDWDKSVGAELVKEYGSDRIKPSYNKAVKVFRKYEFYYFHRKDLKIKEIIGKLGVSMRVYEHLNRMMKEKYGEDIHRSRV